MCYPAGALDTALLNATCLCTRAGERARESLKAQDRRGPENQRAFYQGCKQPNFDDVKPAGQVCMGVCEVVTAQRWARLTVGCHFLTGWPKHCADRFVMRHTSTQVKPQAVYCGGVAGAGGVRRRWHVSLLARRSLVCNAYQPGTEAPKATCFYHV